MPALDVDLSHLVAAVEAQYGLTLSSLPHPLRSGVHSRAWLVTAENDIWVAKLSNSLNDPRAKLEQLTQLYQYLEQRGLACPRVLPLQNGTSVGMVETQHVTCLVQLMRYHRMRQASPDTASDTDVCRVAELAARLHMFLDSYPQRHVFVDDTRASHNGWGAVEEGLFAFIEQQPQVVVLATADQDWLVHVDQRAVAFIKRHYGRAIDLSFAILHGDLNFEHVQFLDDATPYVFDFGDICWGPIAHELAVFLQSSFRDSKLTIEQWEALRERITVDYMAYRQLTSNDLSAIPIFVVNRVVAQARYIVELAVAAEEPINWPIIKRTYRLAEHLINIGDMPFA